MLAAANQPCGISRPSPNLHQAYILTVRHRAFLLLDRGQTRIAAGFPARPPQIPNSRHRAEQCSTRGEALPLGTTETEVRSRSLPDVRLVNPRSSRTDTR